MLWVCFQWQLFVLPGEDCRFGGFKSSTLPCLALGIHKVFPGHLVPPGRGRVVEGIFLSQLQHLPAFRQRPPGGGGRPPHRAQEQAACPEGLAERCGAAAEPERRGCCHCRREGSLAGIPGLHMKAEAANYQLNEIIHSVKV